MERKISIVIPLFNREKLVLETLQSVMDQTYPDYECIIIDDGSTDNSLQAAREFCRGDSRFIVDIRRTSTKGACACRNEGIERACGQYLMFLDSDDLLAKDCLEMRVLRFQECGECDFIVNQIGVFAHKTYEVTKLWSSLKQDDDLRGFVNSEGWQTSSTFFKTAFVKHYAFDEDALSWQDVDFHLRILLDKPRYKKFPDTPPDTFIRISALDRISNRNVSFARIESRFKLYCKLEKIMDAKGFSDYAHPFLIYYFKFIEIAALVLSYREFEIVFAMWKNSNTFANAHFYKIYLVLQANLHQLKLNLVCSALYRVARLFVSRKLLNAQNRKIDLTESIKLVPSFG